MVAFSEKSSDQRQHANLLVKITGEACLLRGAIETRDLVHAMLDEMGGGITDSWLRRIDFCLDVPELSLDEWLLPAFSNEQFLTSAQRWNAWSGKQGCSGFTVGNPKSVSLNVYDKLRHTQKQSEAYQQGMQENRWGGRIPSAATRLEYQVRKPWLGQFGLNQSEDILICQSSIVARLTETTNRPFFAMTTDRVDRKNRHQSRSTRHPEWANLMGTFRQLIGTPGEPLKKIDRGRFNHARACQMLVGFATTAAANAGAYFETSTELGAFVAEIIAEAGYGEERIKEILHRKSLAAGTLKEAESFEFGADEAGGESCS